MLYLTLFLEFAKVGLFALGGGLAALPFLQELIGKYGWMTAEELLNMIAISESTPGAIGINTATFIGYNTAGITGALTAAAGLVFPSLVIVTIIAHYFTNFNEHPLVKSAFSGIRPAVTALIAAAAYQLAKGGIIYPANFKFNSRLLSFFDYKSLFLLLLIFAAIRIFKKHPIFYILTAALIGVIFKF